MICFRPSPCTRLAALVLLAACATGCHTSRSAAKHAAKAEEAGMFHVAAEHYLEAVTRKSTNFEAMKGLQRTGQWVLTTMVQDFDNLVLANQPEQALASWHAAEEYKKTLEATGVRLLFPEAKRQVYESIKDSHLEESYSEANMFLAEEDFEAAHHVFQAILKLNPRYKDTRELCDYAFCEPLYRRADQAREQGRFRAGLNAVERLLEEDEFYKDAGQLRQDILEDGQFGVAILPFRNTTNHPSVSDNLEASLAQWLSRSKDPFLKIVDRENLGFILAENELNLLGATSENAPKVGELLGAKAFVSASISDCKYHKSRLHRKAKTGYEAYLIQVKTSDGGTEQVTKFKEVTYQRYQQTAHLTMRVNFEVTSSSTGAVLFSNSYDAQATDEITYNVYDGNLDHFYSTKFWNNLSKVAAKAATLLLFNSPRTTLRSETEMLNEVRAKITELAAPKIQQTIVTSVQ